VIADTRIAKYFATPIISVGMHTHQIMASSLLATASEPPSRHADALDVEKATLPEPVEVSPEKEQERQVALTGAGLSGNVTVRLKNVDPQLTPKILMSSLDKTGFLGLYDLTYVPLDIKRRKNRGIAFVNFLNAAAAEMFYQKFHCRELATVSQGEGKGLEITPAYVQGFEANFARRLDAEPAFMECIRLAF
jgi:hypothetical protein